MTTTASATSRATAVSVDGDRLWRSLMALARVGATPRGGNRRLALSALDGQGRDLDTYLREAIFADAPIVTADPDPGDVTGFSTYLDRYRAGLAVEAAAVASL